MGRFARKDSNGNVTFATQLSTGTYAENYVEGEVLGEGAQASVVDAKHKTSGRSYAIKVIDIRVVGKDGEDNLIDEINILKKLRHPNIIGLYEVFKEKNMYYLVTEKMLGGELFDRIVEKTCYSELEARDACLACLKAVQFCHKNNIAHRDLKPENLLLRSRDNDTEIKLADFGFAKKVKKPRSLVTMCGTPGYVAPEVYKRKPYDYQADMWSLGVIFYIMLGGYAPFDEDDEELRVEQICGGQYTFDEEYWSHISEDAKDLIRGCLTVKRKGRLSADQALKNQWIRGNEVDLSSRSLSVNSNKLQHFNARRKLRRVVHVVQATNRLSLTMTPAEAANFANKLDLSDDEAGATGATDGTDPAAAAPAPAHQVCREAPPSSITVTSKSKPVAVAEFSAPAPAPEQAPPEAAPQPVASKNGRNYYTLEQLQDAAGAADLPGVDPKNREKHLKSSEFIGLFQCTKEEFDKKPAWKRTRMKRQQKLF